MIDKILEQTKIEMKNIGLLPNNYKNRIITQIPIENMVIIGPRRLGKTRLLQWISKKYSKDEYLYLNFQSLYFSSIDFNSKGEKCEEFVNSLIEILKSKKIKCVLIDEIQQINNWSSFLKSIIDAFTNILFIATGSDARLLKQYESGVGRFKIFFIGFITYKEFKKNNPKGNFNYYLQSIPFPEGNAIDLETRFQLVYEKQFANSRFSKNTTINLLKVIALNPGAKLNRNTLKKQIKETSDAKPDSTQLEKIINYFINSELVYSIEDKKSNIRARKEIVYTLYP